MPSIHSTDGVRLHYRESGSPTGRPVVLIAGFKAPATSWKFQFKALETAGYRVLALDCRGHGESEDPDFGFTMLHHGADIHDLLETLDLQDVSIVGGSLGGNAIWAMLAQFGADRMRDITIVDQTPKMLNGPDWPYGFYDYDEGVQDTLFAEGIPDPSRHAIGSKGLVRIGRLLRAMDFPRGLNPSFTPGELALLNDHAKADWRAVISTCPVPALFVAGRESEFWPAEHAAASAALNPLATAIVIEKDGHAAQVEQPAKFNALLLEFLNRGL